MPAKPVAMRPDRPVPAWLFRAWELIAPRPPLWARRLLGRVLARLPVGSRARRWCLLRMSQITWEALGRSRYDLVLPVWDPAVEWRWDASFVALGWDELYRGHEGVRQSVENWNRNWHEVSFTVREVLDGGDTLLQRVTLSGRGVRSDLPTQMEVSVVARLDPLIVYFYNFLDDAEALREAGFAPAAQDPARTRR
jgi:ketosteroid isomerase-like protein